MLEQMVFPATVEEFMEWCKIVDTDQIYSNGMELVPIFRMKQWFGHLEREKELICECYCKFPEEYRSMYKDVDVAQDNLEREKCDMCPLNKLI